MAESYPQLIQVSPDDSGLRLDQFLTSQLPDISRARVQQLLEEEKILVNGKPSKASHRLKGSEEISILGPLELPPLKAVAEDIPLDIIYEDNELAVVNKPAGMMVHAGAGSTEDDRNRGTLVNALLFHIGKLSTGSDELRPGIVHRLDKETSGLIVVAKNDRAHRKLSEQFSGRSIEKKYLALVHGWPKQELGTVDAPIGRDRKNRARMSVNGDEGRDAVSHWKVLEKIDSPYGKFALVDVKIETGRTHQIRVHLASIGFPVVGDTLYGAPEVLSPHTRDRERFGNAISTRAEAKRAVLKKKKGQQTGTLELGRNFLHAAFLKFKHPKTGKEMRFEAALPGELQEFLSILRAEG